MDIEARVDKVLTRYRESPKLLHVVRTYLRQVAEIGQALEALPTAFDIDSATGDQLTLLGKRLGFPRLHCVCEIQPIFGFDCGPDARNLTFLGFCTDANWQGCVDIGVTDISIDDDEVYRKFLKVRRYQMLALFDLATLNDSVKTFWGDQAKVIDHGRGRVVIAPGRPLTTDEEFLIQVYPRVLPVGLGIQIRFHFGALRAFGFGEGWGGFCDGEAVDGLPLLTESDEEILTDGDEPILTDNLGIGSDWMCEIDVRPYDC